MKAKCGPAVDGYLETIEGYTTNADDRGRQNLEELQCVPVESLEPSGRQWRLSARGRSTTLRECYAQVILPSTFNSCPHHGRRRHGHCRRACCVRPEHEDPSNEYGK